MSDTLELTFKNPMSSEACRHRDNMLTTSLRDEPLSWDYASEYPLVLSPEFNHTSWCAYVNDKMVAHANLWPRKLVHVSDSRRLDVGLVGNVATHPDHRGHGHMTMLLRYLEKIADLQGLQVLVLWSDLFEFYQNLSFSSIGREWRHKIPRSDRPRKTRIVPQGTYDLNDLELLNMLQIRPKLEWTVERSVTDFRSLLSIPETHLFTRRNGKRIDSWLIIGKGSDMRGIIHEWGARSPEELLCDIQSVMNEYEIPELILLTPEHLEKNWLTQIKQNASESHHHPMALGKPIGPHGQETLKNLARGFIWGLDSI